MQDGMTVPLSMDLRERVAEAFADEPSSIQVAARFGVSSSFVRKLRIRLRSEGTLEPRPHGGGRVRCVDEDDLAAIAKSVEERADATLAELCEALAKRTGKRVSEPSMCRALQRLRITRKKRS
jgi:transposase